MYLVWDDGLDENSDELFLPCSGIAEREKHPENMRFIHNAVVAQDIAEVISKVTGIPVSNLVMGEKERLLEMDKTLAARVIGQPEAIAAVSTAVRISRAGLHAHERPLGTFLFLGPTGVGKVRW